MYCIREEDILAWKRYNELEFIQCACRFTENCTMCDNGGGGSKRQEVKTLLRRLKRENPNIENSIFRSIHAVALDTMPGYKSEGVEHSFLERFDRIEDELACPGMIWLLYTGVPMKRDPLRPCNTAAGQAARHGRLM